MKLFALPLLLLTAAPANAITWKEFWEPFDGGHHHHHHYYEPPRPRMCEYTIRKRRWVPGYYTGYWSAPGRPEYIPGRYKTVTKRRWKPCRDFS